MDDFEKKGEQRVSVLRDDGVMNTALYFAQVILSFFFDVRPRNALRKRPRVEHVVEQLTPRRQLHHQDDRTPHPAALPRVVHVHEHVA